MRDGIVWLAAIGLGLLFPGWMWLTVLLAILFTAGDIFRYSRG